MTAIAAVRRNRRKKAKRGVDPGTVTRRVQRMTSQKKNMMTHRCQRKVKNENAANTRERKEK